MKLIVKLFINLMLIMGLPLLLSAQQQYPTLKEAKLIFEDRFSGKLDTANWKVEVVDSTGDFVGNQKGKLVLRTTHGITVWLKKKLSGNIRISYDRQVIVKGGPIDRLSDLNQFWMASDPSSTNLFTRAGKLEDYDRLQLYYVGMGGNYNKTTRFRKYDGTGNKPLIAEYTDTAHLLKPNITYHIDLIVKDGTVSFWVDQQCYFSFHDPNILHEGYFGLRSTRSNQEISQLKVYQF